MRKLTVRQHTVTEDHLFGCRVKKAGRPAAEPEMTKGPTGGPFR